MPATRAAGDAPAPAAALGLGLDGAGADGTGWCGPGVIDGSIGTALIAVRKTRSAARSRIPMRTRCQSGAASNVGRRTASMVP